MIIYLVILSIYFQKIFGADIIWDNSWNYDDDVEIAVGVYTIAECFIKTSRNVCEPSYHSGIQLKNINTGDTLFMDIKASLNNFDGKAGIVGVLTPFFVEGLHDTPSFFDSIYQLIFYGGWVPENKVTLKWTQQPIFNSYLEPPDKYGMFYK